jgi:hypothetical protein
MTEWTGSTERFYEGLSIDLADPFLRTFDTTTVKTLWRCDELAWHFFSDSHPPYCSLIRAMILEDDRQEGRRSQKEKMEAQVRLPC